MANRSMQQKVRKLNKQRRMLPRKYSADYVPVATAANTTVMKDTAQRAKYNLQYYLRGTTSLAEADARAKQAFIEAMFPTFFGNEENLPRKKVRARIYALFDEVPVDRRIILKESKFLKLIMMFNHERAFIIEKNILKNRVYISVNYGDTFRAKRAVRLNNIRWVHSLQLEDESD